MYEFTTKKEVMLLKHQEVLKVLRDSELDPLTFNLQELHEKLNDQEVSKPYNIYITDENLVIKNTTFASDLGFDLSFAKETFQEHLKTNIIGVSTPLFEKSSQNFLSYTDSYIDGKSVLQISYTVPDAKAKLQKIQKLISNYPTIKDAKAYVMVNTGFITDVILKDYEPFKPNLEGILEQIKSGNDVKNKLVDSSLYEESFLQNNKPYKALYLSTKSAIFDDTTIVYAIILDESTYENSLNILTTALIILLSIASIALAISLHVRKKEIRFSEQDKFVQSSMHEIKTPLSIITLNNELRTLEYGEDEYSQEIQSAIKLLKVSYDDMSFTITKDNLTYKQEPIKLHEVVQERVEYFKTIAASNSKTIELYCSHECMVNISHVEITRLIDNNLSNAIKYSNPKSTIIVTVNKNKLSFCNQGKTINDTKKIFQKYVRENDVVGGHGLGLSIVYEIAKKYKISLDVNSTQDQTEFSYLFECHTDDTQSE
jgi:signal transduction histidine kinase